MASEQIQEILDSITIDGREGRPTLILAHGAGADLSSEFMTDMAGKIAAHGVRVMRFTSLT